MYEETAHWIPVLILDETFVDYEHDIYEWLGVRNLERGTPEARNDFLIPMRRLFLFKEARVATEFKLTWG